MKLSKKELAQLKQQLHAQADQSDDNCQSDDCCS